MPKVRTVKIYGSSDDRIYFTNVDSAAYARTTNQPHSPLCSDGHGGTVAEYYPNYYRDSREIEHGKFLLCEKVLVYATYGGTGIWRITVSRVNEGDDYPDWPTRVTTYKNGYSMQVEIDIPLDKIHVQELPPVPAT